MKKIWDSFVLCVCAFGLPLGLLLFVLCKTFHIRLVRSSGWGGVGEAALILFGCGALTLASLVGLLILAVWR